MSFSRELVYRAFPHKEAVLFNLDVAICLSAKRDTLPDFERVERLCLCLEKIRAGELDKAVSFAIIAGYELMAAAIQEHWGNQT